MAVANDFDFGQNKDEHMRLNMEELASDNEEQSAVMAEKVGEHLRTGAKTMDYDETLVLNFSTLCSSLSSSYSLGLLL